MGRGRVWEANEGRLINRKGDTKASRQKPFQYIKSPPVFPSEVPPKREENHFGLFIAVCAPKYTLPLFINNGKVGGPGNFRLRPRTSQTARGAPIGRRDGEGEGAYHSQCFPPPSPFFMCRIGGLQPWPSPSLKCTQLRCPVSGRHFRRLRDRMVNSLRSVNGRVQRGPRADGEPLENWGTGCGTRSLTKVQN